LGFVSLFSSSESVSSVTRAMPSGLVIWENVLTSGRSLTEREAFPELVESPVVLFCFPPIDVPGFLSGPCLCDGLPIKENDPSSGRSPRNPERSQKPGKRCTAEPMVSSGHNGPAPCRGDRCQ